MGITKSLFGINRVVPERKEVGWGLQVTGQLDDLIDGVDAGFFLISGAAVFRMPVATLTLAASATIPITKTIHRISGTSAAVTVDTTTPIGAGTSDGQVIVLTGTNATNTVTIQDGGNVDLNGDITLSLGDTIALIWNTTRTMWEEIFRSN